MEDVQGRADHRRVALDHVGIRDLRHPIVVLDRHNHSQATIGEFSMSVSLPEHHKGAHMSRFVEVLNRHRGEITMFTIPTLLADLKDTMRASHARLEVKFPYFLQRVAPVSGAKGLMDYDCSFTCCSNGRGDQFRLAVTVPLTSVCPCSKEISDYGAHNQRGYLSIHVEPEEIHGGPALIWIEELIEIGERAGSAPVYPLLKRTDERYVTMQAYDKPAFVEDMVRDAALSLKADDRVKWFRVEAVNHESIHSHNVFANAEWERGNRQTFSVITDACRSDVGC